MFRENCSMSTAGVVGGAGGTPAGAAAGNLSVVAVFCTRFLPRRWPFLQDYGPWFRHSNGINLFEATFLDTDIVVLCGLTLPAHDVERTTHPFGSARLRAPAALRACRRRDACRRRVAEAGRPASGRAATPCRDHAIPERL